MFTVGQATDTDPVCLSVCVGHRKLLQMQWSLVERQPKGLNIAFHV